MKKLSPSLGIPQLGMLPDTCYQGDPDLRIDSVSTPDLAEPGSVVFLEQEKLLETTLASRAGLIITTQEFADRLEGKNLLITPKPYITMMTLLSYWLAMAPKKPAGIHPSAVIEADAVVSEAVTVEAGVRIGAHARIGRNCRIGANCVIGDNVSLGDGCILYPNVVIYEDCVIGKEVIIHSGAVIGADGFGFALLDGVQRKIPQIGNVVIGDYVEIGANSCIDRATLGSTVIGEGTKLDNLVQIGHNCVIGRQCILCAAVGLAGSTIVGDYVYLAGQVGAAGHLTIGDRAMIGAQAGITNHIPADGKYFGSPATEANQMKRIMAAQKHLPDIYRFYLNNRQEEPGK